MRRWKNGLPWLVVLALSPTAGLAQSWTVTTVAGGVGPANTNAALKASLGRVTAVAAGKSGEVYLATETQHCIFRLDASGTLTRYAGNGFLGVPGDSTAATNTLPRVSALQVDSSGVVYFVESDAHRVRKIVDQRTVTIAGNTTPGSSGDGGPATSANLYYPEGLAVTAAADVYFTEFGRGRIRKVDSSGIINTIVSSGLLAPTQIAMDASGAIFGIDLGRNALFQRAPDGKLTFPATGLAEPSGLAVDPFGTVYLAEAGAHRVRKIAPNGGVSTVAGTGNRGFSGDGGPADQALLNAPSGLALDADGNLYIADTGNRRLRKVSADGMIQTVAGDGTESFTNDGRPATTAMISEAPSVTSDAEGNFYIADTGNARIRKVTPAGVITSLIETPEPTAVVSAPDGTLLVADATDRRVFRIAPDGSVTPVLAKPLDRPVALALSAAGDLYIADQGAAVIYKVDAAGNLSVAAGTGIFGDSGDGGPATEAELMLPTALAVGPGGELYLADAGAHRVRRVDLRGTITTVAGMGGAGAAGDDGPAAYAWLREPRGLAVASDGTLYVADSGNHRVRRVDLSGWIEPFAGSDRATYTAGRTSLGAAAFRYPTGLAWDLQGRLLVADTLNRAIRRIEPQP